MNEKASNSWPFFILVVWFVKCHDKVSVTCNGKGVFLKVSNGDAHSTSTYLLRAASRPAFWREVPFDKKLEAVNSLNSIGRSPSELTEWINKYLTAEQINKLGASIRQSRRRGYGVGNSITISDNAHRILKRLSEGDGCSLSKVIEKRLARAYKRTWDHK